MQILQILQGYIFPIAQNFATELCNFTNFKKLFVVVLLDFILDIKVLL